MKKAYCILRNKEQFDIDQTHPMYCCEEWIEGWVNDLRIPISYHPARRAYYILAHKSAVWIQLLLHCPICLKKFPHDLSEMRDAILEKEYGITEYSREFTGKYELPKEFYTEEWWRKRGL